jgi:phosphoglycolate phosphatase-like HAD superfamily hydrolase
LSTAYNFKMKLFVWDFHGVLEKGNEKAAWEITNQVLKEFGFNRQMTEEECFMLYGKKWHEYFAYLLPEKNIEMWLKLQSVCISKGLNNPNLIANHIKINDFAAEVLEKIGQKHEQILMSNSSPESLEMFIKITGVNQYFNSENIFALDAHKINNNKLKNVVLEKYLSKKHYEKVIIVGDAAKDMMSEIKGNVVRYLYAHPKAKHREAEADYKIYDLREVLREI